MAGYSPLYIKGMAAGLVQSRENFILPDDAYPTLENAYVWRERIKRKQGYRLLGRLQRIFTSLMVAGGSTINPNLFNLYTLAGVTPEATAMIVLGSVIITLGPDTFTDNGSGILVLTAGSGTGSGTINYFTGAISITTSQGPTNPITVAFNYYPGLPVMGLRIYEQVNSTNDLTIAFDQKYAYTYNGTTKQWQEWIPGTTWNAHNEPPQGSAPSTVSFFWTTNYWTANNSSGAFIPSQNKLFWVTNNTGVFKGTADPIRVTDGVKWLDFIQPTYGQIDATNFLVQCLAFLPFRGRLVAFNTWEGTALNNSTQYSNRIRWSTIGNPFIPFSNGPPATGSWRDDIRGKGGFLDIPTSEDIVSVGFVRDNLVIYCERSTWQLRYTGRSIAPFQIEKVNSELGAEGTFSAVQFDTSLIGIGDKGVVECDSFKSERIDVKIPDLVFNFQNANNGPARVYGIRDFEKRLAYWLFPANNSNILSSVFPNSRLLYNYENDSWSIFTDSLTCLGTIQIPFEQRWIDVNKPWIECNFPWVQQTLDTPSIIGGNQQGFVETLDVITTNDISLFIQNITSDGLNPTVITSPNHNFENGTIIQISNIPIGTPYSNLNKGNANNGIYAVNLQGQSSNTFTLLIYNPIDQQFDISQVDAGPQMYIGGGTIAVRDNFNVTSKKFNMLDDGQSIQMGYIDILMDGTYAVNNAGISLNVYLDYNDNASSNTLPDNEFLIIPNTSDTFFNQIIPTTASNLNGKGGTKFWQRVYCATRANFLTIQYIFSNLQMASIDQESDVQIDSQVIWLRRGGRLSQLT